MAGAMEESEPGGAYSVAVWRWEKLEPGKRPVFTGFENSSIKRINSPPHISEECTVANNFQKGTEHIKTCYRCNVLQI